MTPQEIQAGFETAVRDALQQFIGKKSTEDLRNRIIPEVAAAMSKYYLSIPLVYRDLYRIKIPNPEVRLDGTCIYIDGEKYL